ncbi:MAG TPA: methyltransferase domain-containing protein [Acidobacteriota bacterium]|nr:methyltransferase domain-containing protein [Acidobacteriota bacterium]
MNLACPTTLDAQFLRSEILSLYSRVLADPDGQYHFHRGAAYACEFLGYNPEELALLPEAAKSVFAGIGNPLGMGRINPGEWILDIGCGAGMDLLLAAIQTGPSGRAVGVDMTPGMLEQARAAAKMANLSQVEFRLGDATCLPLDDGEIDVVISNGVLNLVPEKNAALTEIRRVLKPGGRVQIADIALDLELSNDARADIDLWTG